MELQELMDLLSYPEPLRDPVLAAARDLPGDLPLEALTKSETCQAAWEEISSRLPSWQEDGGMAQLAAVTAGACLAKDSFRALGIPDPVFVRTMEAIPRFLRENRTLYGKWVYDRGFWTWRQTGGLLFRLGTLEFEYRRLEAFEALPEGLQAGDPVLSVHIPSDAQITRDSLDGSYAWARRFFRGEAQGPWQAEPPRAFLCSSWLLADTLQQLLPEASGIRLFAADYQIYARTRDSGSFYRWLYQLPGPVAPEALPERTGLQRALKAHLLSGGRMGTGAGLLPL